MSDTPQNTNGDKAKKQTWYQFWERVNVDGLWMLLAFGVILILTVIALAFSTDDIPVRATILAAGIPAVLTFIAVVIQAAVAKQMAEIMDRQETEATKQRQAADAMVELNDKMVISMQGQLSTMKDGYIATRLLLQQNQKMIREAQTQRETMQESLAETRKALKQTDDMFYASNRAYIGSDGIGIETEDENIHRLPEDGLFRIACGVINKGHTPAIDFQHVFRLIFTELPVPAKPIVDFKPFNENQIIPHILPDKPEMIYGDPILCESDMYKQVVIERTMLMIVSVKFSYTCLDIKDETFIAHHIWDVDREAFIFRRDWPAGTVLEKVSRDKATPK